MSAIVVNEVFRVGGKEAAERFAKEIGMADLAKKISRGKFRVRDDPFDGRRAPARAQALSWLAGNGKLPKKRAA